MDQALRRTFHTGSQKSVCQFKGCRERLKRYNNIESEPLYHPPPLAGQLKTGEQGEYIFYPSRLEPQKRQDLLIEAMRPGAHTGQADPCGRRR